LSGWIGLLAAILLQAGSARPDEPGELRVRVLYRGDVPLSKVPDDLNAYRPLLTVDGKSHALADAVAWIEPLDKQIAPVDPPLNDAKEVVIDQRDMTFLPHVAAIRAGQKVRFTNHDNANHNVRSAALKPANQFNVFTGNEGSYVHAFMPESKNRPVRIGCDIHGWMAAWVYVFEHPRFGVSNKQGEALLTGLAPGRYRLHVRQPDGGLQAERDVQVLPASTASATIEFLERDLAASVRGKNP
jgi:plastocyanin